jgi:hypothetical protein
MQVRDTRDSSYLLPTLFITQEAALLRIPCVTCGPLRDLFNTWFFPVKDIIHDGKKTPGDLVSRDKPENYFVGEGPRVAPRAHPHTDVAVRTDLSPVLKAGLIVQFPPKRPIHYCLILFLWN